MPKRSISVTLEETTIESLRDCAEREMRSISNLIDYIVMLYTRSNSDTASAKLRQAQLFANNVPLRPFGETQDALKQNVFTDAEDRIELERLGGKAK